MKTYEIKYRSVRGGKVKGMHVRSESAEKAERAMREALRFRPDAVIVSVREIA